VTRCGKVQIPYLGTTITNTNCIHEKSKSRLNSESFYYHSGQNFFSSHLLPRNLQTKIYKTIILSFVLYGCKTWSLTLREKLTLMAFENRMLRRVYGHKMEEVSGS